MESPCVSTRTNTGQHIPTARCTHLEAKVSLLAPSSVLVGGDSSRSLLRVGEMGCAPSLLVWIYLPPCSLVCLSPSLPFPLSACLIVCSHCPLISLFLCILASLSPCLEPFSSPCALFPYLPVSLSHCLPASLSAWRHTSWSQFRAQETRFSQRFPREITWRISKMKQQKWISHHHKAQQGGLLVLRKVKWSESCSGIHSANLKSLNCEWL